MSDGTPGQAAYEARLAARAKRLGHAYGIGQFNKPWDKLNEADQADEEAAAQAAIAAQQPQGAPAYVCPDCGPHSIGPYCNPVIPHVSPQPQPAPGVWTVAECLERIGDLAGALHEIKNAYVSGTFAHDLAHATLDQRGPTAQPAPELAAAKPGLGTAWRLLNELRASIAELAERVEASARATRPSRKSQIEDELAIALRQLLEGK